MKNLILICSSLILISTGCGNTGPNDQASTLSGDSSAPKTLKIEKHDSTIELIPEKTLKSVPADLKTIVVYTSKLKKSLRDCIAVGKAKMKSSANGRAYDKSSFRLTHASSNIVATYYWFKVDLEDPKDDKGITVMVQNPRVGSCF